MFGGKGRALMAVLIVVTLAIPTVSVLASSSGALSTAAAAPGAPGDLNWELVHQAPAGVYYYSIFFPTKDVGYAVGGPDWNNATSGRGAPIAVSKTTDGGKTWVTTNIPGTDGWARGLACKDADNCWIAGNNAIRLLRTTDGGKTWTGFKNISGYTKFLWSTAWTKNGTTVLSGTTCYDPDPVEGKGATANWLRSTDGETFSGVQATPGQYMCYVQWDIDCPSPGFCYSAGKSNVWRSHTDGQTWVQTSPGSSRWYGLSCTANNTCWVVGKSPFVKSTTNSGGAWYSNTVSGLGANGQFWDVAMLNERVGYAAGCSNVATDMTDRCLGTGVIYKTVDGETWNPIASPTKADIMDLWAFSESEVYVVDFSGKIWRGAGAPTPTPTPTATSTPTTGLVTGFAFDDRNGDALQDEDETGLSGATIVLRRGRTEIATAISGDDGAFQFEGIEPGQYTVEEKSAPTGYARSRFLGTFRVEANRGLVFYVPHDANGTATVTPTSTPTPGEVSSATPTAEVTGTQTPAAGLGYIPIIIR